IEEFYEIFEQIMEEEKSLNYAELNFDFVMLGKTSVSDGDTSMESFIDAKYDARKEIFRLTTKTLEEGETESKIESDIQYQPTDIKDQDEKNTFARIDFVHNAYSYVSNPSYSIFDQEINIDFDLTDFSINGKYYVKEDLFKDTYTIEEKIDGVGKIIMQIEVSNYDVVIRMQMDYSILSYNAEVKMVIQVKAKNVRIKEANLDEFVG
ncbi:MAG: hypothetical protein J6R47_00835, partial [Acholeplasmatales bacterium]|nr:hypothetical protein [Acholeplasmatales bacterium]